jgi:urease accessory protein
MSSVLELLLADSRTPSGGYAHSGGLEAAVEEGLAVSGVAAFVRARLRTVGRVEAAIAALAADAATLEELLELDQEMAARTLAEPLRRASRQLGLGLLRTACSWWPDARLLAAYRVTSVLTPRAVALGAIARSGGLGPLAAARISLYDDAATVAAAAVKLLPLDAARASAWLAELAEEIEELAAAAVAGGLPPGAATPLLDRRAMLHERRTRRLFVS